MRNELRGKVKFIFTTAVFEATLINNFNSAIQEPIWVPYGENYAAEFAKQIMLGPVHAPIYFWRTYADAEIDFISEKDGILRPMNSL